MHTGVRFKTAAVAAVLCLVASASAQARLGQYLATAESASQAGRAELMFLEPMRGDVLRVDGPFASTTVRAAAVAADGKDILVAERPKSATADVVMRHKLNILKSEGATVYAKGFRGVITGMALLADGRLAVATTWTVYAVPAGGGDAKPLVAATRALGFVDVAAGAGEVIALQPDKGITAVHVHDLKTGKTTVHGGINIRGPESIADAPDLGGWLVGNGAGSLYLVNASSLLRSLRASLGSGPVASVGYNPDHRSYMLGGDGRAHRLVGTTMGKAFKIAGVKRVLSLSYNRYRSSIVPYGKGCPGASGKTPKIANVGLLIPGNATFAMTLADAPARTPAALLFGGDKRNLELSRYGMPGCFMLTTPKLIDGGVTDALGRFKLPIPVAALPDIVGGTIYFQWAVHDRKANPLGVIASAGIAATP